MTNIRKYFAQSNSQLVKFSNELGRSTIEKIFRLVLSFCSVWEGSRPWIKNRKIKTPSETSKGLIQGVFWGEKGLILSENGLEKIPLGSSTIKCVLKERHKTLRKNSLTCVSNKRVDKVL